MSLCGIIRRRLFVSVPTISFVLGQRRVQITGLCCILAIDHEFIPGCGFSSVGGFFLRFSAAGRSCVFSLGFGKLYQSSFSGMLFFVTTVVVCTGRGVFQVRCVTGVCSGGGGGKGWGERHTFEGLVSHLDGEENEIFHHILN